MKKKKILFIENRRAIFYYDKVAEQLSKKYEIHWLVQNNLFVPKTGINHIIKYPSQKNLNNLNAKKIFRTIYDSDRGRRFYHNKTDHYQYYYQEIEKIIKKVNPSLIIGEADLFHELMVIDISKKMKIRYIFPAGTRYPKYRTSFYKYDTLNPLTNKGKPVSILKIKKIAKLIKNNKYELDYMQKENFIKKIENLYFQFYVFFSYIFGEKFNTPSPIKFVSSRLERSFLKVKWRFDSYINKVKTNDILENKKIVLFPLQMQPEVSTDVWSYPYINQEQTILELSKSLKKINYVLAVKANPKFKFELNIRTYKKIKKISNVILIPQSTSMNYLLKKCNAIFSITGTVIFESVFLGKNIFVTSNSPFSNFRGVTKVNSLSDVAIKLKKNDKKNNKKNNLNNTISLLKTICKTSFPNEFNLFHPSEKFNNYKIMTRLISHIEKYEKF